MPGFGAALRVSLRDMALQRKLLLVSVITAGISLLAALLALASPCPARS